MSNTLIAPEHELFPNRYRWTVAECYEMAAEGRLAGRYEILDGEVVSKMGQNPPYRIAIILLQQWLLSLFYVLNIQTEAPIALSSPDGIYSEPEPDVAVTREPTTAYATRQPGPEDLLLVVEVSDTTLRTDQIVKARLYARAGIPEYWLLDLNARQLYIYRNPFNDEYRTITVHVETETVALTARPDASVTIADLLPPVTA